ncbi:MAG: V-type ATP synthase subunit F [Armatimonadetes bacterium CG07_land_8_20_14_0_80_40_9]|nr:MAG: V-type ATP synthase subunit F [Armatimonadetes bacterium CG07_land_8_20_14_0_80_40_9]
MDKIGVIGDRDSIMGFKPFGISIFPVEDEDYGKVCETLKNLCNKNYAIVFITEEVALKVEEVIKELNEKYLTSIVTIPNNRGSLGVGWERMRMNAKKAIGSDILFEEQD